MKTNSKQVREQIRQHILDCVYDYMEQEFPTFEQALDHLVNEFKRVANYPNNLKLIPNDQERFSNYLCGLPFHFEYSHAGIVEYLNSLGINPEGKEFSNDKSMHLYHYLIFKELNY